MKLKPILILIFCHFQKFSATIGIEFHEEFQLQNAIKDLLDYLENLTGNMNARVKI